MCKNDLGKQRIAQIRDSAGSFTIGDSQDGAVQLLVEIDGRLYAIKESSIYTIALADDIDPERTNENIPNTVQKVFNLGSKDDIVIKLLLTGIELFKQNRLVDAVNYNSALSSIMNILKDLADANSILCEVKVELEKNREIRIQPRGGAVSLPSFPMLHSQTKSFIQKLDHAMQNIFNLICVFYDEKTLRDCGKWLDGLTSHLSKTLNPDENFQNFAGELAIFGKMVRNTRHCIEHPSSTQRIDLYDYKITVNRVLEEPTITVTHKEIQNDATPIDQFMCFHIEQALHGTETLMAFLAGHHVAPFGVFQIGVGEIPEDQRRYGVRYGYLLNFGGKLQRLG